MATRDNPNADGPPVRRRRAAAWERGLYTVEFFRRDASAMLAPIVRCPHIELAREQLLRYVTTKEVYGAHDPEIARSHRGIRLRDCARTLRSLLSVRSDERTGFSVTQALLDIANHVERSDLGPGFFAEMIHMVRGLEGRAPVQEHDALHFDPRLTGRAAAIVRSDQLDLIARFVERAMRRFPHGLRPFVKARRRRRTRSIRERLGATEADWNDWRWHVRHVIKTADQLRGLVDLSEETIGAVDAAVSSGIPFGVTPFYLSLMDDSGDDAALRAQVFPSAAYVHEVDGTRGEGHAACDFMLEKDTSPIDLITRRYPSIVILKPFNTCPQICVYCQRNWEIDEAMAPGALAPPAQIEAAIDWIRRHRAVREVLVTGGDPLALDDDHLIPILDDLASIRHVERIRIGTRTPVTLPMRVTESFADHLGGLREPGRRDVAVITHIEHPYEINPQMVTAVDRLRRRGIGVYNQLVFTFFNSRRFEAAGLRRLLRRIGVDPYYVFNTKGKAETAEFRVPIARLMQELKEEARLLPGLERTDEAVYNLPRLGKTYLRAVQHRDVLTIRPDGSRVYEFHPWEKNIVHRESYVGADVPILDYLERLHARGENPGHYDSIWYYY